MLCLWTLNVSWLPVGFLFLSLTHSPCRMQWALVFRGWFTLPDPLLASLVESPSLVPRSPGPRPPKVLRPSPLWPVRSQQPPSPLVSEEPRSCLGQAGPPTQGADKALMLDSRWVPGCVCTSCQGLLSAPQPRTHCPGGLCPSRPRCLPGWPDSAMWLCGVCVCVGKHSCLPNCRLFWLMVNEFVFSELYQLGRGPRALGGLERNWQRAGLGWAGWVGLRVRRDRAACQ